MESGVFPNKYTWKHTYKQQIAFHESLSWQQRSETSSVLKEFRTVHNTLSIFNLWTLSIKNHSILNQCRFAVYLIGIYFADFGRLQCHRCGFSSENIVLHYIYECIHSESDRQTFWREIQIKGGPNIFRKFTALNIQDQISVMFSSDSNPLHATDKEQGLLTMISLRFLYKVKLTFDISQHV